MNRSRWITSYTLIAAVALAVVFMGCKSDQLASQNSGGSGSGNSGGSSSGSNGYVSGNAVQVVDLYVPSGTSIDVTLGTTISSEAASVGDSWNGVLARSVIVNGTTLAPAGSAVGGTVTGVTPAKKGDRAMLDLGLTSFNVGDRNYRVHGSTEAVIAGSTRARNLGAIAAATVAGAVVGHQIGGSDKGTIIGGIVGAGAATGVVSQTKGWQVVLKQGTPLTFTTSEAVAVRQ
jgi:hypothetical protein